MNSKKTGVLLTGATGFLGSHLLKALLSSGEYEVVIAKRSTSDCRRIENELEHIKAFDIDNLDFTELFSQTSIEQVIHTAVEYGRGGTSSYEILNSNLMFPIALIESCIQNGVKTFINTDSYFNKENMAYSYLLNYSLSKKSFNLWLRYFSKEIKVINAVLEHIYGPWDSPNKFVEKAMQMVAVEKASTFEVTQGHQKRDFIYVDDVVSAYLLLLKVSKRENFYYREYSIGTGEAIALRDFLDEIKSYSESSTEIVYGALPYRDDEIMSSHAENIELQNIGWQHEFDFKKGIKKIIDLYTKENL